MHTKRRATAAKRFGCLDRENRLIQCAYTGNTPSSFTYGGDGLGSVIGTVDAAGNLVSTRKYDVYGAVRWGTGPAGPKHRFVGGLGHPSEEETGLIYMRARYYDPVTGRFISEDLARDGINQYIYRDLNSEASDTRHVSSRNRP